MMMEKIVVGYDGSNTGKAALAVAKEQSKAFDAKVFVIESQLGGSDTDVKDIKKGEETLEFAESYLKEQNIPCETHLLVRGVEPGEDIVQFAKDNDADLIIVGVRRRSKVGKLMFGSTAQYVILEAPCPVLTVK
jgi:nucleotide-binding universal stress UspA family protein